MRGKEQPRERAKSALSLLLLALAVLEALYLAGALRFAGLFPAVGADFRALHAAARIAREQGFSHIYDMERHIPIQQALCRVAGPDAPCVLIPMVFLPVFLLPVLPLTFLGPVPAFAVWSVLNVLGALPILRPWVRSLPASDRRRALAMALLSFPVFSNLLWGQSNLWLMLCVASFLREWERERPLRAGLWASGLLLKPQTMVLLVPALALARRWDILAGLAAGGTMLFGASRLLVGPSGMVAWAGILTGFSSPAPALVPEVVGAETMINWRSIGLLLSRVLPSPLAWGLTGAGMLLTVGVALAAARRTDLRDAMGRERFTLGVLAATLAATWHAHGHTAMVLLPPLLALEARRALPRLALPLWALLPAWVPFVSIALEAVRLLPFVAGLDALATGKILFGFNLWLVLWTVRRG
ncbi:MAG: glycosyltransferase family 87 protein [Anaerolineae bacterium]